jgi:hypothetical protein
MKRLLLSLSLVASLLLAVLPSTAQDTIIMRRVSAPAGGGALPTTDLLRDYDPESVTGATSGVVRPQGSTLVNSANPGTGDITWSNSGGGSDCAYIWTDDNINGTWETITQGWGSPWGSGCVFGTGNKGSGQIIPASAADEWHIFLVIKRQPGGGLNNDIFQGETNALTIGLDSDGKLRVNRVGSTVYATASVPVSMFFYELWSVSFNNSTSTIRIRRNGVTDTTVTGLSLGFTPNQQTLDWSEAIYAHYGRILIYSEEQAGADLSNIENYFLVTNNYTTTAPGSPPSSSRVLWAKADAGVFEDAGTDAAENGDGVQQWNDQSGGSNHFSQGTSGERAVYTTNVYNGLPALRFDASNDGMTGIYNFSAMPYTIHVVYSWKGNGSAGRRVLASAANNWLVGPYGSQHQVFAGGFISAGGATANVPAVITVRGASSNNTAYKNGVAMSGSAGGAFPGVMSLGAESPFAEPADADVFEIIGYNADQSSTDRENTILYLAGRMGL